MFKEIVFWEKEKVSVLLEKLKHGISTNTGNIKAFGAFALSLPHPHF